MGLGYRGLDRVSVLSGGPLRIDLKFEKASPRKPGTIKASGTSFLGGSRIGGSGFKF